MDERPQTQIEQGDIEAFTRSLRMQGTPWALGCEALILNLWREARLTRSERGENDAKDAARYRWWRERFSGDDDALDEINDAFREGLDSPKEVDAAIDAAMNAAPQVGEKK
jgi:hypothetical protein